MLDLLNMLFGSKWSILKGYFIQNILAVVCNPPQLVSLLSIRRIRCRLCYHCFLFASSLTMKLSFQTTVFEAPPTVMLFSHLLLFDCCPEVMASAGVWLVMVTFECQSAGVWASLLYEKTRSLLSAGDGRCGPAAGGAEGGRHLVCGRRLGRRKL